MKYKAVTEGLKVVKQDGKRFKLALNHPTLSDTIDVPKEIPNAKEIGLELVSETKKK